MPSLDEPSELLTLYAGSLAVGVPVCNISEIIEPVSAASVPLTCPGFLGMISVRGTMYPLLRLSDMIPSSETGTLFSCKDAKAVICSSPAGNLALEADAVGDTLSYHSGQLSDFGEPSSFFTKKIVAGTHQIPLLDLNLLTAQITRSNDQVRRDAGLAGRR